MSKNPKESLKKQFPGLPVEDVMLKSPTQTKSYLIWALEQLKNKKTFAETMAALEMFHRNKKYLIIKNISQFKDPEDISKVFRNNVVDLSSNAARKIAKAGARKIFEDDSWLLLEPETSLAAALYGKGTKWCTSALDGTFEEYTCDDGTRLCILINKKSNDKRYSKFVILLGRYDGDEIYDAQDRELGLVDSDYADNCDCFECTGIRKKRHAGKAQNSLPEEKLLEFYKLAKKSCHGYNKQTKFCKGKLSKTEAEEFLKVCGLDLIGCLSAKVYSKYKDIISSSINNLDNRLRSSIDLKENLFWDYNIQEMGLELLTIPDELYRAYFGRVREGYYDNRISNICNNLAHVPLDFLVKCSEDVIFDRISNLEAKPLNEMAQHTSVKIRKAVAQAPKSKKELIQQLIHDPEEEVRREALQRLNKNEIRSLLKKEDYEDKFNAAVVLSKRMTEKELANLILRA